MTTGDVELTILDNGAGTVTVPASTVQVVMGCCSGGTVGSVVATVDPGNLFGIVGAGPGTELAALSASVGGTVLFVKTESVNAGSNSAVVHTSLGTCTISVTGEPLDAYMVRLRVVTAGTVGTDGIRFRLSVDAGRNEGRIISLGTSVTYVIAGTGLTLNFGAGTLLLGGTAKFYCTPPTTDVASIISCLTALDASPYSMSGWGSIVLAGEMDADDADTVQTKLATMADGKTYTRAIISTRDAAVPTAWGGAGETEQAWIDAITLDVSALDADRVSMSAGHYNIPSIFPIVACGLPRYRRPGAWAYAARQVTIAPQRHAGAVVDKGLAQIVVNPSTDPNDGFVYHDERTSPSLDTARFTSYRTRKGKTGFFVVNPKLMSAPGSVFSMLPIGNVMDIGCDIVQQTGELYINSDVALNNNGTIEEKAAQAIELANRKALRNNMVAKKLISSFSYTIDRTNNVRETSEVNFSCTLFGVGYILQINGTIGFGTEGA